MNRNSTLATKGYERSEVALSDPHGTPEVMGNKITGGDPARDRSRGHAKHLRGLGDGEEPDAGTPIMAIIGFRTTRVGAAAGPISPGQFPFSRERAPASCLATNALMLATVILRERPSL